MKTIILQLFFLLLFANLFAQGTWVQKADFGGSGRYAATGFSIGAKGYIGTGYDSTGYQRDFWEWDQAGNTWTQKEDFPGAARFGAAGFSIGAKGYVGTGYDSTGYHRDFWEWDQLSNVWMQKADFGGTGRYMTAAFSIGTKGYIGTGFDGGYTKDFWEWDQDSDKWTQKQILAEQQGKAHQVLPLAQRVMSALVVMVSARSRRTYGNGIRLPTRGQRKQTFREEKDFIPPPFPLRAQAM